MFELLETLMLGLAWGCWFLDLWIGALFMVGWCAGYGVVGLVQRRRGGRGGCCGGDVQSVGGGGEGGKGVDTLPAELWSLVIDHVVVEYLDSSRYASARVQFLLELRRVCHK